MNLSAIEMDIIGRARLHGDASIPELAKRSGHQVHTVRYVLDKLLARDLIKLNWVVDHFKLGWDRYSVLFALAKGDTEKLERFFSSRNQVIHFGEPGGSYDYGFAMIAKSTDEVLQILEEASQKSGAVFSEKIIAAQTHVAYFAGKYLCKGKPPSEEIIEIGNSRERISISTTEEKILTTLMSSPYATKKELAEMLQVSQPTIYDNLANLKKRGVLKGARWSFASEKFNFHQFKLIIRTSRYDSKERSRLFDFCRRLKNCTSLRAGIGSWDFEANFEARNYEEILTSKKELWRGFSDYFSSMELIPRFGVSRYVPFPLR